MGTFGNRSEHLAFLFLNALKELHVFISPSSSGYKRKRKTQRLNPSRSTTNGTRFRITLFLPPSLKENPIANADGL